MKRPKYRNVPTIVDGIRFDSKAEARRYGQLKLLEHREEISRLELQPKYVFSHNGVRIGSYTADFAYFTPERRVVEDVKSAPTARTKEFRRNLKLMEAFYPGVKVEVVYA